MRNYFFCLSLLGGTAFHSFAQDYSVQGTVQDSFGENVPHATIALKRDSTLVSGTISDSLGYFLFEGLNVGNYTLVASHIDFREVRRDLSLTSPTTVAPLVFTSTLEHIEEVAVVGRMPLISRRSDRYVVNMQRSAVVRSKDGLQALNYAPGVYVNPDKTITLNGKENVVIFLNGRKMNMARSSVASFLSNLRGEDI